MPKYEEKGRKKGDEKETKRKGREAVRTGRSVVCSQMSCTGGREGGDGREARKKNKPITAVTGRTRARLPVADGRSDTAVPLPSYNVNPTHITYINWRAYLPCIIICHKSSTSMI